MKIPRTPLFYIVLGFLGGVIIARNAAPMNHPEKGTVLLAMLVGGFVLWRAGYKGKSQAVANAVAIATATATASADARAQAVANQAVSIFLTNPNSGIPAGFDPVIETAYMNAIDEERMQDIIDCDTQSTVKSIAARKRAGKAVRWAG